MAESKKNRAIAAELIAKASRDSSFRKQFLANPKAALIAAGAEIASGIEIRVVESTEKLRYILLPALPGDGSGLTEAQLAAIAGGGSTVTTTNTVQTAEAQTTTVQTEEVATTAAAAAEAAAAAVCVIVAT